MAYSEKLNGYWEEGYHYYMEFRDEKLTMREYRRKIILETTVRYDAEALDRGEETEIIPADPVFARWPSGEMSMEIRSLRYVGGELKLLKYYTIMGEKEYTLRKVDGGPFRHIYIRDEEVLPRLQGKWKVRTANRIDRPLTIQGNSLRWDILGGGRIHAVSYDYAPEKTWLVPEDLTESGFGGFDNVEVRGNMLVTRLIVSDMSVPPTVFGREEDMDSIELPDSAKAAPRSAMGPAVLMTSAPPVSDPVGGFLGIGSLLDGMAQTNQTLAETQKDMGGKAAEKKPRYCAGCGRPIYEAGAKFCPECGHRLEERKGSFCPDCGYKLEEGLRFCPNCGSKL